MGTGYSYTEETDNPHIGDEATARDSHTFLERFLGSDYFPQFADLPFHIWGESYAGIYIPTLANQILLANDARAHRGLGPSVNLIALGRFFPLFLRGSVENAEIAPLFRAF